ncbi:MAG TPA: MarR family transcriptional regulator [Micromonosporaceae bacterium]
MSRGMKDDLRDALGASVRAFQRAVDALDEAVAAHLGVNRTDLRCLDVLIEVESATPGLLAERLGLTTGSVTAMLDRLERLGYLTRSADPADRRRVIVRPTESVVAAATDIYGPLAAAGEDMTARYTAADLRLLMDYLDRGRALQEEQVARIRSLPRPRR